jgi:BMFP domain-containing protein YqiC
MRAANRRSQAAVAGGPSVCGSVSKNIIPEIGPSDLIKGGAFRPPLRAEQTVTILVPGIFKPNPRPAMTQTTNRFFDEMARLMNDAAGVASGVRREFDTMVRNQADRILRDLDIVKREEFEAVKEMARIAREENEALKARIAALEAKLGSGSNP